MPSHHNPPLLLPATSSCCPLSYFSNIASRCDKDYSTCSVVVENLHATTMPDQKTETKKGGLRGIFKRKESLSDVPKPAGNTDGKPQEEQSQRPPARRTYTPRYAERDMILSVPVEDRPDLVAKAKETSLKRTCSDIGFATSSSSRSSSSHARSVSLNLNALSTHPNLHISSRASIDPATPGSASSSLRSLAMQRHSSMPTVPRLQSANGIDTQWKGLAFNGPPSFPSRPRPRATQSQANIPQMIPESLVEHVDQSVDEVNHTGSSEGADNDTASRSSTPSSGYRPEIARRPRPTPIRQRSYFSHKGPLPDLRTKSDKGKEREQAREWEHEEDTSPNKYNRPSHRASDESMSDYVISTEPLRASQTAAPRLAPPPPPSSSESTRNMQVPFDADSAVDSGSTASAWSNNAVDNKRAHSVTESESNATDHSSSCNNASPRNSSVSTALTAHSDVEDVRTEKTIKLDDGSAQSVKSRTYTEEEEETELQHIDTAQRAVVSV